MTMAISPDDVDKYLFAERLRGIKSMREHNLCLSEDPAAPGQSLLIAELDELGVALEHFCRLYLSVDSLRKWQLDDLLYEVSKTLDSGGADPREIQKIRSHLLHDTLPQAESLQNASENKRRNYVNN
jgi:hypothetical protein